MKLLSKSPSTTKMANSHRPSDIFGRSSQGGAANYGAPTRGEGESGEGTGGKVSNPGSPKSTTCLFFGKFQLCSWVAWVQETKLQKYIIRRPDDAFFCIYLAPPRGSASCNSGQFEESRCGNHRYLAWPHVGRCRRRWEGWVGKCWGLGREILMFLLEISWNEKEKCSF